jgi:hypothetical protein
MGVISDPPPTPVMPTIKPTSKPEIIKTGSSVIRPSKSGFQVEL